MINTFKPYIKLYKRFKGLHDWIYLRFEVCNSISLGFSLFGYGFDIGIIIYEVNKYDEKLAKI